MPISEARRRANDKYIKEKYERLPVSYPKEFCERVRKAAADNGESLAGYVKKAIDTRMEKESQSIPDELPEIDPLADLE